MGFLVGGARRRPYLVVLAAEPGFLAASAVSWLCLVPPLPPLPRMHLLLFPVHESTNKQTTTEQRTKKGSSTSGDATVK